MQKEKFQFQYEVYADASELKEADQHLLSEAKDACGLAYAPYSNFQVGAAARMQNGEIIKGGNQENASRAI